MKFRLLIGVIISGLVPWDAYSQQKLDKHEILKEYRTNRTKENLDSIFLWGVHSTTRTTLDNLLKRKIDTLLVYAFYFPGRVYLAKHDTCSTTRDNSYFFWKEQGEYFFYTTDNWCDPSDRVYPRKVVEFAVDNFSQIKDEFFMNAVSSAEINNGRLRVSESWVDHEPKYSILVIVHGQYNYLTFTENGLTNKKSLFLDYNKALKSFDLFSLIKKEIKKE